MSFKQFLNENKNIVDMSKEIDKKIDSNDIHFKEKLLKYFKSEYPSKKFSSSKIFDTYYDMVDNNHIKNIYSLLEVKENYIVIDIPKNISDLKKVLKFVKDDSWDKSDIDNWVKTKDVKYIFYDKTRDQYNYTNYEQDYNSDFFKKKNLRILKFDEIK